MRDQTDDGGGVVLGVMSHCGCPETAVKIQQRGLEDFSSSLETFLSRASYRVYFLGKQSQGAAFGSENINVSVLKQIESIARGTACFLKCRGAENILFFLISLVLRH